MKCLFKMLCAVLILMACENEKSSFNGQLVDAFPAPVELEGMNILEFECKIHGYFTGPQTIGYRYEKLPEGRDL